MNNDYKKISIYIKHFLKRSSSIEHDKICCDIKYIQTIENKWFQRVFINFDIDIFILTNECLSFIIINKMYCRNCFAMILLIIIDRDINKNIFFLIWILIELLTVTLLIRDNREIWFI